MFEKPALEDKRRWRKPDLFLIL